MTILSPFLIFFFFFFLPSTVLITEILLFIQILHIIPKSEALPLSTFQEQENTRTLVDDALEAGDVLEVSRLLTSAAKELNDTTSMNMLALHALIGEFDTSYKTLGNVEHVPDFSSAVDWFNSSASHGNASAQSWLALFHSLGNIPGIPQSDAKAVLFSYFSALGGTGVEDDWSVQEARLVLGYRHANGYSVPRSCSTAAKYYEMVAQRVIDELTTQSPQGRLIEKRRLAEENKKGGRGGSGSSLADQNVLQYYTHAARHGDVNAQVALGQLHFFGAQGVPRDTHRALEYFTAATSQGDSSAQTNLAQMYAHGIGVPQDNTTALKLFTQAAKQGNPAAENGLGYMYLNGLGVRKDLDLAISYFQKAAKKGNVDARYNLGVMYFSGIGVEKNHEKALQYFTLAAHQGHTRSLFNMAQIHLHGIGAVQSCSVAIKLLKAVAERGDWVASTLEYAYRLFVDGHIDWSFIMYAKLAESGHELAQHNVAWILDNDLLEWNWNWGDGSRARLAFRYFSLAAEQGNADAARIVGDYLYYGKLEQSLHKVGDNRSEEANNALQQASKRYRASSDSGNAQASFNLGYMYEWGYGLEKDFLLAKRYYDQAILQDPLSAYAPVTLALWFLQLHIYYDQHPWLSANDIPLAAVPSSSGISSLERRGPDPLTSQKPADALDVTREYLNKDDDEKEKELVSPSSDGWTFEDFLLLALCGLFGLLIFIRNPRVDRRGGAGNAVPAGQG